jgi:hypothetical protein
MVAVPLRDEKDEVIAEVLFGRWIAIFGPPLQLYCVKHAHVSQTLLASLYV